MCFVCVAGYHDECAFLLLLFHRWSYMPSYFGALFWHPTFRFLLSGTRRVLPRCTGLFWTTSSVTAFCFARTAASRPAGTSSSPRSWAPRNTGKFSKYVFFFFFLYFAFCFLLFFESRKTGRAHAHRGAAAMPQTRGLSSNLLEFPFVSSFPLCEVHSGPPHRCHPRRMYACMISQAQKHDVYFPSTRSLFLCNWSNWCFFSPRARFYVKVAFLFSSLCPALSAPPGTLCCPALSAPRSISPLRTLP